MMKYSPGNYAKKYAKENPDFKGRLITLSITPAGKGGTILKDKQMEFLITEGGAALIRSCYIRGEGFSTVRVFNGICHACGIIYLKPVLSYVYAPDPEAGQVVPQKVAAKYHLAWDGWTTQYASMATLCACPDCIAKHGLQFRDERHPTSDPARKINYFQRPHPTLVRFKGFETRRLDVRQFYPGA